MRNGWPPGTRPGRCPGSLHLYIGQEAVAVGVCAQLGDRDYVTSTHRGHGHYLAKGGDVAAMFAEIWGKREGICRGMGGSMHVADLSKGMLGANGIVGAGLAIATGAAFGAQLDGDGKVAVCFFGDGAANQGVLMETLNVAAVWGLPVIFVCENNTFSEFTPVGEITAGRIGDRARAFDVPTHVVDGNDVVARLAIGTRTDRRTPAPVADRPSSRQTPTAFTATWSASASSLARAAIAKRRRSQSGRRRTRSIACRAPARGSGIADAGRARGGRRRASSGWSTPPRPPPTRRAGRSDARRACDVRRLGVVTRWSGDD